MSDLAERVKAHQRLCGDCISCALIADLWAELRKDRDADGRVVPYTDWEKMTAELARLRAELQDARKLAVPRDADDWMIGAGRKAWLDYCEWSGIDTQGTAVQSVWTAMHDSYTRRLA